MDAEVKNVVDDLIAQLASKGSRRVYSVVWRRYVQWLKNQQSELLQVRPRHIQAHLTALRDEGKSKATIGHALSVIREAYGALVREELLVTNPAREVKPPKISAEPKAPWLDETEVRRLFALPTRTWEERRERMCLSLLLGLGWRRAEVAALRVEDFDGATVTGTIKGDKRLTAGVPAWVLDELSAWRTFSGIEAGPLLPTSPDCPETPMTGDQVYACVTRAGKRAGVDHVTPHALRRTNITLGGKRGVSLRERQLAVGHVSGATTERYDRAREAAFNAPGQVLADLIKTEGDE